MAANKRKPSAGIGIEAGKQCSNASASAGGGIESHDEEGIDAGSGGMMTGGRIWRKRDI